MVDTASAAVLRRFNRTWTQRVGVLEESFLGTGRPLAASRLLFEIGTAGAGVAELRDRLGLDSGYLSRLVRRLEHEGLAELEADPHDGRRRRAVLTADGLAALHELDARSDALAERIAGALRPQERARLEEALRTADLLVRAATLRFEQVDPRSEQAQHAMQRYFGELARRFPAGFDPGDTTHSGPFLVALDDGRSVAGGGVRTLPDGRAEVKRMWVDPAWRGVGLGAGLLGRLEQLAVSGGHHRVVLDTNGRLTQAIALYDRSGYRRIERYNDNPHAELFFEKDLRR